MLSVSPDALDMDVDVDVDMGMNMDMDMNSIALQLTRRVMRAGMLRNMQTHTHAPTHTPTNAHTHIHAYILADKQMRLKVKAWLPVPAAPVEVQRHMTQRRLIGFATASGRSAWAAMWGVAWQRARPRAKIEQLLPHGCVMLWALHPPCWPPFDAINSPKNP